MKSLLMCTVVLGLMASCGQDRVYHAHSPYQYGPVGQQDFGHQHPKNQIVNECGSNYTIAPSEGDGNTVNVFCGDRTPNNPVNWQQWSYGNYYPWNGFYYHFWY